jgi:hypothetical protein
MRLGRILYRLQQFWHISWDRPRAADLEQVRLILSDPQWQLFQQLPSGDQAHAIRLLQRLIKADVQCSEILIAALLHDIGKSCYPWPPWQRGLVVLAQAFFPTLVRRWGSGEAAGWRRPFVIYQQHAAWGAQMALQAGAAPMVVSLISRHQDQPESIPAVLNAPQSAPTEAYWLAYLQKLDEES